MQQVPNNETEAEFDVFVIDGSVVFIHNDVIASLLSKTFKLQTRRASFVEPTTDGKWSVDVSPVLGTSEPQILAVFDTRKAALEFENRWLLELLKSDNASNILAMQ